MFECLWIRHRSCKTEKMAFSKRQMTETARRHSPTQAKSSSYLAFVWMKIQHWRPISTCAWVCFNVVNAASIPAITERHCEFQLGKKKDSAASLCRPRNTIAYCKVFAMLRCNLHFISNPPITQQQTWSVFSICIGTFLCRDCVQFYFEDW